jgi:hypothetical protein
MALAIVEIVETWSHLAAWLEYDQDLPRERAEWAAMLRIPRLERLARRASLAEVYAALCEAEAGRTKRLEGLI